MWSTGHLMLYDTIDTMQCNVHSMQRSVRMTWQLKVGETSSNVTWTARDVCRSDGKRRCILRDGSIQCELWARLGHLDDACALRPDAAKQVRAPWLRPRGMRLWRHRPHRHTMFRTSTMFHSSSRRSSCHHETLSWRPQALPRGTLCLR